MTNLEFEGTPAEAELIDFVNNLGSDILNSAYYKLELGMATPAEQQAMATFIRRMRDLIKECVVDE
jgi:hypothetical protein